MKTALPNPEPLAQCQAVNCHYPVCHCYDAATISAHEADQLLTEHLEPMLIRLKVSIDTIKELLKRPEFVPYSQLKVYRKRKARLQKNFVFLKIKYDMIKHGKK